MTRAARILWVLLGVLCGMLVGNVAFAGGSIPQNYGLYQDGRVVDYVPAHHSLVRWYWYGGTASERAVGELAFASASIDLESTDWRLLYGGDAPEPASIVAFSFKNDPTDPRCLDDIAGNCTLARTECVTSFKDGSFRFCQVYRVSLYVNNMKPGAEADGIEWEERLYGIIRHEWGHVLGLTHDGTGPMTNGALPFTACQLGKWSLFHIDPAITTWSFPVAPQCVQPQAQSARVAQVRVDCPSIE